jgi:hypothetical protein
MAKPRILAGELGTIQITRRARGGGLTVCSFGPLGGAHGRTSGNVGLSQSAPLRPSWSSQLLGDEWSEG